MMTQQKPYGSIILRLMVSGTLEPFDSRTILWGELLHVAAQNGVLIRVVDQLRLIGLEPRHFFYAAVTEMRARNQKKLSLMAQIGKRCVEGDINFIFAKALQSYPDMGGDIDLFVSPRAIDVDAVILRGLKGTPVKRNLRNRIDGTATYRLAGCESLLDIHHGRVGMLGEHKLYVGQIIKNARQVTVGGEDFLIPSPEDQLILQAMQKVVQRSYLRLSDILTTIDLVRGQRLDWNYILNTVKDLNILYGLNCYLHFVNHVYREAFEESLLRPFLQRSLISKKSELIEFKDGFYRFPRVKVGSRGYINKFCSALLSENWSVASRLSLLPVLALSTAVRKLRTTA